MTPSGIETATVAQHLNQCATAVPQMFKQKQVISNIGRHKYQIKIGKSHTNRVYIIYLQGVLFTT